LSERDAARDDVGRWANWINGRYVALARILIAHPLLVVGFSVLPLLGTVAQARSVAHEAAMAGARRSGLHASG
jgi:hypothetical protein